MDKQVLYSFSGFLLGVSIVSIAVINARPSPTIEATNVESSPAAAQPDEEFIGDETKCSAAHAIMYVIA